MNMVAARADVSVAAMEIDARLPEACAQSAWAAAPLSYRLEILRAARHRMSAMAEEFAAAISSRLARTSADTLVCELLPLLDAIRFLEKRAEGILRTRKLGPVGRPLWLSGVRAEVQRDAWGHVLILGPANFPLFLPGVQAMQALAAGNRVTWKPGEGGRPVASLVARALSEAGLPAGLLTVTEDSAEAGAEAVYQGADRVVCTGSARTGEQVLQHLAESATPAVMELSGADAVIVLPSADLDVVAKAVAFGLRLNGGAVCMSPRRLIVTREMADMLTTKVLRALDTVPAVTLEPRTADMLTTMLAEAEAAGATVRGELQPGAQRPVLVEGASAEMQIARSDIFAPVISVMAVDAERVADVYAKCPYALTASIFCGREEEAQARALAAKLRAGVVLINDVIAPTADPRLPFGGRGASGFGVTRGAEGLLEMTTAKVVIARRGGSMRHMDATTDADAAMFGSMIRATHARTWRERVGGLRSLMKWVQRKSR